MWESLPDVSRLTRIPIDPEELRNTFCLGVAGNFAGHLEQAGEAVDFEHVQVKAEHLPKGIFPWFVPGSSSFLGAFPLSSDQLSIPNAAGADRIQVEPEVGLLCHLERSDDGSVRSLHPRWIAAFDDCSLRRPGAAKISEKKNWGAASKGVAHVAFEVSDIEAQGSLATLRLASYLQRDGVTHPYGIDSEVATYSLCGAALLDWLVDRLNQQRAEPGTPLEDVGALLAASGDSSTNVFIGIGATRYEPFGETTFVRDGDEAIVVLYDGTVHEPDEVTDMIAARRGGELRAASVLRRRAMATATAAAPD